MTLRIRRGWRSRVITRLFRRRKYGLDGYLLQILVDMEIGVILRKVGSVFFERMGSGENAQMHEERRRRNGFVPAQRSFLDRVFQFGLIDSLLVAGRSRRYGLGSWRRRRKGQR